MNITVIVTAHNRKQYIFQALESISNQSLPPEFFEVIVVKNFIDEKTDKFISDHGYKSLISQCDSTIGEDLSSAIDISNGEIIAFLDDDDVYSRDRLNRIYEIFNKDNVSYFKNEVYFIDDSDRIIIRKRRLEITSSRFIPHSAFRKNVAYLHRVKADFNLSSIAIRKDVLNKEQIRYLSDRLTHSPDTFFLSVAMSSNKGIYLSSEKMIGYRINDSTSKRLGSDPEAIEYRQKFWKTLMQTYDEFSAFSSVVAKEYLENRKCSQYMAMEISRRKSQIYTKDTMNRKGCLRLAIKQRDMLLLFDYTRYLVAKLRFHKRELT